MVEAKFAVSTAAYQGNTMANICDEELVGRIVTEGKLKVHLSKEFYNGEALDKGNALHLIRSCSIVNLAGERIVTLAIENKIGAREAIREIDGVPFLMIYKFLH